MLVANDDIKTEKEEGKNWDIIGSSKNAQSLTSILTKWQRDSPMGVGISRKSMVGFEGLWVHDNFWNFFGPEVSF